MSKLILWRQNYRAPFQTCHELGQVPCGSGVDSDRVDKLGDPASGMAECSEQTRRVTVLYEAAVKCTEDLKMHEWVTWRKKSFIQLMQVL